MPPAASACAFPAKRSLPRLVKTLGSPLTATSANPQENLRRERPKQQKYFAGQIDIFLDGGELTSKNRLSVVEIVGESLRIIRAGDITKTQLEEILGPGGLSHETKLVHRSNRCQRSGHLLRL
jgi:tRNA A37 threonylcarbamoyladenosine synthetase subunit TsaC/SUA5/YrdC